MYAAPLPPPAQHLSFRQGLAAPWQAAWFLLRTPRSWPLAFIPLACALLVAALLFTLAAIFLPDALKTWLPPSASPYGEAGRWALTLLTLLAALLLSLLAGLLLAQPLASPALERLARLYDMSIGRAPPNEAPFWESAARSLRASLVGLAALPLLALLMVVDLLVPGAFIVLVPLKILLSGFFLAWDYLDYPLGMRGWGARDRARWVKLHLPALLGMGASLALALLIPFAQLFVLPVGVVAAALLYQRSPAQAPLPHPGARRTRPRSQSPARGVNRPPARQRARRVPPRSRAARRLAAAFCRRSSGAGSGASSTARSAASQRSASGAAQSCERTDKSSGSSARPAEALRARAKWASARAASRVGPSAYHSPSNAAPSPPASDTANDTLRSSAVTASAAPPASAERDRPEAGSRSRRNRLTPHQSSAGASPPPRAGAPPSKSASPW